MQTLSQNLYFHLLGAHFSFRYRRTWKPNVQSKTLHSDLLNQDFKVNVTTHAMRCIDKAGGVDKYLLFNTDEKISSVKGLQIKVCTALPFFARRLTPWYSISWLIGMRPHRARNSIGEQSCGRSVLPASCQLLSHSQPHSPPVFSSFLAVSCRAFRNFVRHRPPPIVNRWFAYTLTVY